VRSGEAVYHYGDINQRRRRAEDTKGGKLIKE
jgi:hypothetical protein